MKKIISILLVLSLVVLVFTGCAPKPAATPEPSATPESTATATPAATPTATPTPAATPEPTAEPEKPVTIEAQEGRYIGEGATVDVGGKSVKSTWLPMQYAMWGGNRQVVNVAVTGDEYYVLTGGYLSEFALDNGILVLAQEYPEVIPETNNATYGSLCIGSENRLVLTSGAHYDACILRDGKQVADNAGFERLNKLIMHPSGEWGITSWVDVSDLAKVTIDNDVFLSESYVELFTEMTFAACVGISENHILISGKSVETENTAVFVYDLEGNLELTLGDVSSGEGKLTLTCAAVETSNGYVVGGDFGDVTFFDLQGNYICDFSAKDMFGSGEFGKGSKWLHSLAPMPNGDIIAALTVVLESDGDTGDITLFTISGF